MSRFLPSASTASISLADDAVDLRDGARAAGPRRGHRPADEVRPQPGGGPEERVAFGHSGASAARGAQDEAAIAGHEAGLEQSRSRTGDVADGLAVDLADDQLADPAVGDERARAPGPRRPATAGSSAAGERLERGPAALEVERRDPVDEHDVRAGRPLERPPVGLAAARPGQRGAVRVGRIGGGEQVDRRLAAAARRGSRTARSRSSAPASANWAAPRPSTK